MIVCCINRALFPYEFDSTLFENLDLQFALLGKCMRKTLHIYVVQSERLFITDIVLYNYNYLPNRSALYGNPCTR